MSGFGKASESVDLLDLDFDQIRGEPTGSGSDEGSAQEELGQKKNDFEEGRRREAHGASAPHLKDSVGMSTISFNAADEANEEGQDDGKAHGRRFLDNLTDPRASAREYEVVFGLSGSNNGKPDLGLTMEADYYGRQAIVKGFSLVNGKMGPAQACGLICVGDVMVAVGSDRVKGMTFPQTLSIVREACRGRGQIRLTFTAGTGEEKMARRGDSEMLQARWFIHQQKARYYRPPPPDEDMVYCSLERHRGEHVTSFHLHRDDTGEFLLACSVDADLTGPMLFHTLQDTHLREMRDIPTVSDSAVYLGCMVPNFLGTEFRLLDHRINPRDSALMEYVEHGGNHELSAIVYELNVLGRVPNSMKVLLRRPRATEGDGSFGISAGEGEENEGGDVRRENENDETPSDTQRDRNNRWDDPIIKRWETSKNKRKVDFRPTSPLRSIRSMMRGMFDEDNEEEGSRQSYATLQKDSSDIIGFETLKPTWNDVLHAWTLNFNGRVKIPSKKNFLVAPEKGNVSMEQDFGEGRVHVRHGKMSKSRFSVDFRHPISPLVALGVCCSTFSNKRAVT